MAGLPPSLGLDREQRERVREGGRERGRKRRRETERQRERCTNRDKETYSRRHGKIAFIVLQLLFKWWENGELRFV